MSALLKSVVLLLFAANVLTSRPQGYQNSRNSFHHAKNSHYVRTFTKYHHRRPIRHYNHWPLTQDHQKVVIKRSIPFSNLESNWPYKHGIRKRNVEEPKAFIGKVEKNQFIAVSDKSNIALDKSVSNTGKVSTKSVINEAKSMSCLYKIHSSMSMSVTPSYDEEKDAQINVENVHFELGSITRAQLPNGETSQMEQCTDPNASCYTLWHQDNDGNITVLGQGCWRSTQKESCDKCTRVNPRLPGTRFCCCTKINCNGDFLSLREEIIPLKVESTMETPHEPNYSNAIASAILALAAILVMAVVMRKTYCRQMQMDKDDGDAADVEKGDVMGSGPDALATGLSCVDNLTLVEHIGQGKFGSVWRGSLGSTPVAVKLYANQTNWQKEAGIYSMPHLAHPNILKYYGSDNRPTLNSGVREWLIVLELCPSTLRQRLQRATVTWMEFATLAHGLASAVAHLHNATPTKPCIVHRDINSNNVLVTADGQARLADLGLAQTLPARLDNTRQLSIEAGTIRYLAPEALDGAIDVSGALSALRCVDVFALALVLWELLWRCAGAHAGPPPPHQLPYQRAAPRPTPQHMQNLVSRNKVRPPLPNGPVAESRALKIACETCDECWDHDAEARLTAVCVEERMAELKHMLQAKGPVIHDNNLHPHGTGEASAPETEKNSNCTTNQTCDVTTPLLYPQPHIGRNACIQRNTNTQENTQTNTQTLIHKSLKDISAERHPNAEETVFSVARNPNRHTNDISDRLNEIRSYQRPLEYIPNDVSSQEIDRLPKETNLLHDKPKWGIKKFFERKSSKSKLETEVKLVQDIGNSTRTSLVNDKPCNIYNRPSNLVLDDNLYNMEAPCLSPPNRTLSPTMMIESEMNRSEKVFAFKELPLAEKEQNKIFAVIVPKAKPNYIEMKSKTQGSSDSINKSLSTMSSQSMFKYGNSESEDSTIKKRLSDKIITNTNSGRSSRASINLELQYMENQNDFSPFEVNSDCSSSEDENLMLLSENGGSKITMQPMPKQDDKKKYQNDVLKEATRSKPIVFNQQNKYSNFDNEYSDPNDKENLMTYSGDNPVYLAALNGEIDPTDLKIFTAPVSPKPSLKSLAIKRQHSLEQVSEIFSSSGDLNLQNPAGRVKTPGDLPVAVRRARRDRALQKGRANESNRLSLYDDRMMFGNSL